MRTAVLGMGIMGAGMATSLAREGHDVAVWNRSRDKAEAVAGAHLTVADSVTAAVEGADAVITMLLDTAATLAVSEQIVAALGTDAVWIQSATVGPQGARTLGAAAQGAMLDAPVLGTKKPAEEGALVVLAAGPQVLLERAAPVFDAIGSRTMVVGDELGQASALKLACNAWVGLLTAGTAQSLALAENLGVDPALFLQAIAGGPLDTPYAQLKGRATLAGEYPTSFAVDGVTKDIGLMIEAANSVDVPTGLLQAVLARFEQASADGHGQDDMAAVRTAF